MYVRIDTIDARVYGIDSDKRRSANIISTD